MNHDGSDLDNAIVTRLQGDAALSALLPDGVFIEGAPPGAGRYALVDVLRALDEATFDGGGFETVRYQVTANGSSEAITGPEVKQAAARIDELLHGVTLPVVGFPRVTVARIERVRLPAEGDPDDASIRWYRRGGMYELFASK